LGELLVATVCCFSWVFEEGVIGLDSPSNLSAPVNGFPIKQKPDQFAKDFQENPNLLKKRQLHKSQRR
jgi:hypothetical protein